jgi:hypothetical protein
MDMPRRSTLVPLNKVMVEMATKGHLALFDMRIIFVTTGGMRSRLNTYGFLFMLVLTHDKIE